MKKLLVTLFLLPIMPSIGNTQLQNANNSHPTPKKKVEITSSIESFKATEFKGDLNVEKYQTISLPLQSSQGTDSLKKQSEDWIKVWRGKKAVIKQGDSQATITQKKIANAQYDSLKAAYDSLQSSHFKRLEKLDAEILDLKASQRVDKMKLFKNDSTCFSVFLDSLTENIRKQKNSIESNIKRISKDSLKINNFEFDSLGFPTLMANLVSMSAESSSVEKELEIKLESRIEGLKNQVKAFNAISILFDLAEVPYESIRTKIELVINDLKKNINDLTNVQNEFKSKFHLYADSYNKNAAELAKSLNNKKEKEKSADAAALAKLTSPLNESGMLIPEASAFAFKSFNDPTQDNIVFGQAKLFFAGNNSDTSKIPNGTRIFLPEASNFGLMIDFVFGFDKATYYSKKYKQPDKYHSLGITAGVYYLQKKLNNIQKENSDFTIGMIQTRIGIEKTIVRNALLFYAKVNGFYVGRGAENFKLYYDPNENDKMRWYAEIGIKSYLTLSSDKTSNLILELRFLPVNTIMKNITTTTDKFIPMLSIGYSKSFEF